jgi:methionine synthase II (cobalamin-independent)
VDDGGDRVAGAVDIYYWSYPAPLYDESQDIMLPASRPLELQTLIRMLGTKDRRESAADRYRDEYREALEQMKAMNPRFTQPKEPTNRTGGSPFNMNHR